jgi:hypothetical protein
MIKRIGARNPQGIVTWSHFARSGDEKQFFNPVTELVLGGGSAHAGKVFVADQAEDGTAGGFIRAALASWKRSRLPRLEASL